MPPDVPPGAKEGLSSARKGVILGYDSYGSDMTRRNRVRYWTRTVFLRPHVARVPERLPTSGSPPIEEAEKVQIILVRCPHVENR